MTPEDFSRGAFQWLSVNAAHQRSKTWADADSYPEGKAKEEAKDKAKRYLYRRLKELAEGYREGEVEDAVHEANIVRLARDVTRQHGEVLHEGRYRIGTAQKALNLYLKYLWCAGRLCDRGGWAEPPHCPFDSQVINKMMNEDADIPADERAWTKVDDREVYRRWVREARTVARRAGYVDESGKVSLARWELDVWRPA